MKQGRSSGSAGAGRAKVEPTAKQVNPGAVSYLGEKLGNHAMEEGDMTINATPWSNGRGYMAPMAGSKRHKNGSQGSY